MTRRIGLIGISLILLACSVLPVALNQVVSPTPEKNNEINTGSGLGTDPLVCPTCEVPGGTATPICPSCETPGATATPISPSATPITPTVTNTSIPSNTPTQVPSATFTPVPPKPVKPYSLQSNTPVYQANFAQSSEGCNWMGVVGQAFDLNGNPVKNLVLVIEGTLANVPVENLGLTGANLPYGPSGYEIALSRKPLDSAGTLNITLYDLAGNPLSDPVSFNTYGTCDKNLVIINFKQTGS